MQSWLWPQARKRNAPYPSILQPTPAVRAAGPLFPAQMAPLKRDTPVVFPIDCEVQRYCTQPECCQNAEGMAMLARASTGHSVVYIGFFNTQSPLGPSDRRQQS